MQSDVDEDVKRYSIFFFHIGPLKHLMFLLLKNKDPLPNDMQGTYHVLQGRGYVFL